MILNKKHVTLNFVLCFSSYEPLHLRLRRELPLIYITFWVELHVARYKDDHCPDDFHNLGHNMAIQNITYYLKYYHFNVSNIINVFLCIDFVNTSEDKGYACWHVYQSNSLSRITGWISKYYCHRSVPP